jgi:2-polyprenyl-3-methyl-5-hydroxy-6-metoxy-1,4-benzoquinol methylase
MVKKRQPYHKYVFKDNKFVGKFEQMYNDEDKENFDSWHQEDMRHLCRQTALMLFNRYNFSRILDVGCGKGVFAHALKKNNNYILGIDISKTAIKKAMMRYPDIDFRTEEINDINQHYDLAVITEVLSYLSDWKEVLIKTSKIADYVLISLYLPPNPAGYVKSFRELLTYLKFYFNIETKIIIDDSYLVVLGKSKNVA